MTVPQRSRRRLLIGAIALLLALPLLRAVLRPGPKRPNILFVLVDTLRADRVQTQDGATDLTPFLARFSQNARVFERAYAASSWTFPSVASIFLAQLPFVHRVIDFGDEMPAEAVTLAEALSAHGYETAAFLANAVMESGGFQAGFGTFQLVGTPSIEAPPDAPEVNQAALAWLDRRSADRPFFLYLHYFEPHYPYKVQDGFTRPRAIALGDSDERLSQRTAFGAHMKSLPRQRLWAFTPEELRRLRELYDGEVAALDHGLAALFAELEARGALADTIVVITADHGEEFGEHGIFTHGISLYESAIHVPLIVRFPGDRGSTRIARPVENAGLAPALLRAVGIDPPPTFMVPALPLDGGAGEGPPIVSQLQKVQRFPLWTHCAAILRGDRKLLVSSSGVPSVYDLRQDAGEARPGPPDMKDLVSASEFGRVPPPGIPRPLPPETLERLRALGYVGAEAP